MPNDDLRGLVLQGRGNILDPAFLAHVFDRPDEIASRLETMKGPAGVDLPTPPDNVVSFCERRGRRNG